MLGTIVNVAAIFVCSTVGLFLKGVSKYEKGVITAMGYGVIFLGFSGALKGLSNMSTLLFMLYLVCGTVIGEMLKLDDKFNRFGEYLEKKGQRSQEEGHESTFAKGFITATLIYCVGAMSIIGALEDSLGNHSVLFTKSVMDGVTSLILASVYGVGVLFSGFAVLLYQGTFTLFARVLSPIFTEASVSELSTVGSVLVAAIGFEMLGVVKIKCANMLPAMFLPIIFHLQIVSIIITAIFGAF